ncbi:MAG: NikA [Inoviridae sp.]|nr:MAG: NikA [Inoviridae sp.]
MAITIRLTEEQENLLDKAMVLTGQNTKSKFFLYMLENADSMVRNDSAFRQIKSIEEDIKIKEKMIKKLKTGNRDF